MTFGSLGRRGQLQLRVLAVVHFHKHTERLVAQHHARRATIHRRLFGAQLNAPDYARQLPGQHRLGQGARDARRHTNKQRAHAYEIPGLCHVHHFQRGARLKGCGRQWACRRPAQSRAAGLQHELSWRPARAAGERLAPMKSLPSNPSETAPWRCLTTSFPIAEFVPAAAPKVIGHGSALPHVRQDAHQSLPGLARGKSPGSREVHNCAR